MSFDRAQGMQALTYLAMVFFVAGGLVSARYRRHMRWAAIGLYGLAVAAALVMAALWLLGIQG